MERDVAIAKKPQQIIDSTIVDPFTRYLVVDKHIDDPYIPTVFYVEDLYNSLLSTALSKQELEAVLLYQNFCKILPQFQIDYNGIVELFNKFTMWNDYTVLPILSILTVPILNKDHSVDLSLLLAILPQQTNDYVNYDVETSTVFLELTFQQSPDYVNLTDTHVDNIGVIVSPYDASAAIYSASYNLKQLKNGIKNPTEYLEDILRCLGSNVLREELSFMDII